MDNGENMVRTPAGEKGWPSYASAMILCFDRWENGVPAGKLWSYCFQEPRPFRGLDGVLFAIEEAVEESGRPQAWCRPRDLSAQRPARSRRVATPPGEPMPVPPYRAPDGLLGARGKLCTAMVRVHSRQHASLQGELVVDGRTVCFRSGMELMRLLREFVGPPPAQG